MSLTQLRQRVPGPIKWALRPLKRLVTTKGREELLYWKTVPQPDPVARDDYYRRYLLGIAGQTDDSYVAGKVIADFGCGPMGSLTWARSAIARIGIDVLSDLYADEFREAIQSHGMIYVKSTEKTIPLPTAYVDVMFTLNAMDHVDDFPTMCQEILRVIKPGGEFVGSFNLGEDPTMCEPQRLTEDAVKDTLLKHLEIVSYRTAPHGPEENPYGALLDGTGSQPIPTGKQGYLWVRARKAS
jgi:SAM-dependent methyltransferase